MDPTAVIETYPNRKDSPIGLKKILKLLQNQVRPQI